MRPLLYAAPRFFRNVEAERFAGPRADVLGSARMGLIDELVGALKISGSWARRDVLYLFTVPDQALAAVNWIRPGRLTLSRNGGVTHGERTGFAGNGTDVYLGLGTAANALGQYAQNDAHLAAWQLSTADSDIGTFGNISGTAINSITTRGITNGGLVAARMNATTTASSTAVATAAGLIVAVREDSANVKFNKDGAVLSSTANTSTGLGAAEMCVLRSGATAFHPGSVAMFSAGLSLSDAQMAADYAAFLKFFQRIGAV